MLPRVKWPLIAALWLASIGSSAQTPASQARLALMQFDAGQVRGAATTVRQAIRAWPGDPLLHNLAAALLFVTGDTNGAESVWRRVAESSTGDAVSGYGLALVALRRGRADDAAALLGSAVGPDAGGALIVARYIEHLSGARSGSSPLTVPDPARPSASALMGMALAREGHGDAGLEYIADALTRLDGDPFDEPPGILMTFDPSDPLRPGLKRLPTGNGLSAPPPPGLKFHSGTVAIGAGALDSDTGYVAFRVDEAMGAVINSRPFTYYWDTRTVADGRHVVDVVCHDLRGAEINRTRIEVVTRNGISPGAGAEDERAARTGIWRMLSLRPSRLALAYKAFQLARSKGDMDTADRYIEMAAAVDPRHKDVRIRYAERSPAESSLWRGGHASRTVALTFDDGPKPGITEEILAILVREQVPATFFVIGRHAASYPDLVRKMVSAGMELDNHSYTHANLTAIPTAAAERELVRTNAAVAAATGKRPRFFRPPGGNVNGPVVAAAAQWGLTPCMWSVNGEKQEKGSARALVDYVVNKTKPGAIVLLHNGRQTTIDALPAIIAGLKARGYGFVTVEELDRRKKRGW